jgi:hypothetical protein
MEVIMLKRLYLFLLCTNAFSAQLTASQKAVLLPHPQATAVKWMPALSTIAWYTGLAATLYVFYDLLAYDGRKTRRAIKQTKKALKASIEKSTQTITKLVSYEGWLTRKTVTDKGDQTIARIAALEKTVAAQTQLIQRLLPNEQSDAQQANPNNSWTSKFYRLFAASN